MSLMNLIATILAKGDMAVQVEYYANGSLRIDRSWPVTIARETATQWIDNTGNRYRKSDGAELPVRLSGARYIVTVTAFDAAVAKG